MHVNDVACFAERDALIIRNSVRIFRLGDKLMTREGRTNANRRECSLRISFKIRSEENGLEFRSIQYSLIS